MGLVMDLPMVTDCPRVKMRLEMDVDRMKNRWRCWGWASQGAGSKLRARVFLAMLVRWKVCT